MLLAVIRGLEMGFCISEPGCKFSLPWMHFKHRLLCFELEFEYQTISFATPRARLVEQAQGLSEVNKRLGKH